MHGYIAGKLFKEGDRKKRIDEYNLLQHNFPGVNWYCPLCNDEINDKTRAVTAEDIFDYDTEKLVKSRIIVAELDDEDPGTVCELGIIMQRIVQGEIHKLFVHASDLRMQSTENYAGVRNPYGYNQYLVGGLLKCNATICKDFEELIEALSNYLKV